MKIPFVIYCDLESLLEKTNPRYNDPEKSSTTKINKHVPSGCSLYTHCSFDNTKNKLDYYRGKYCMKEFCKALRKYGGRIIYWEKTQMILLTDKENKSHENQKRCYICNKTFTKDNKKVRDHYHLTGKHRGAAHNKCNINYKIAKDIPVVFHNGLYMIIIL